MTLEPGAIYAAKFRLPHGVTDRFVRVEPKYIGADGVEVTGELVSARLATDEERQDFEALRDLHGKGK